MSERFDLMVIGGGPGGMGAALVFHVLSGRSGGSGKPGS